MKKIICIVLSAVIILSGLTLAFADDDSASVPEDNYGSAAELSEAENEFLSKSTSESDFEVRKAIINSVRSVAPPTGNETASDIYELLYSCWTSINLHYSLYVYDDQNYSVNSDIRTALNEIVSTLYGNTGIASGDVWSLLKQIAIALTTDTNSNIPGAYTIHHNVDLISQFIANGLFDSNQNPFLQGISSNLTTVSANLASQMNQVVVIRNKIDSIESNVDYIEGYSKYISEATEKVLVPRIEHIDNDLHNLNQWLDEYFNYNIEIDNSYKPQYYYIDNNQHGSYPSTINGVSIGSSFGFGGQPQLKPIFPASELKNTLTITYKFDNEDNGIFSPYLNSRNRFYITGLDENYHRTSYYMMSTFVCNVIDNNSISITYDLNGVNLTDPYFTLIVYQSYYFSYTPNTISSYSNFYPLIVNNIYVTGSYIELISNNIKHIDNDLHLGYDILNTFKELYASDDLINAKENQKIYEDQVIDDFTGSGSAAAKASDAASAKDISSAVSSGLSSGANVNNSLGVFNTNSGFWGWFSQDNSDLINTLSSQNRLRSSGSGSDWVIDDPYQRNAEELQSILGGNR